MDYDLSKSELQAILTAGKHHRLPKGQVLQLSEERMLINSVQTGYIKRYSLNNDGSQSIQSIYGPGNVFPLTPVYKVLYQTEIYRGSEVFYYEALTPVSLHSIDRTTLLSALEKNQMLYSDLFQFAGRRLSSNIQKLENMALKTANRRVCHQLAYYCQVFGKQTDAGTEIQLPLTHQTLASILNLARETVTICMTKLQRKGLLKGGNLLLIPDVEALRREVR